ncbi:MAG TPA: MFS transporter, partial [Acidimicrobiales bacterium]|nr:MFS transporter [Acidimicrobiales bacterium]
MPIVRTTGRVTLEAFDPDDPEQWDGGGASLARRTLGISMFAEHLGFVVWALWTVVVLDLGDAGIALPLSDRFVLTLLPNLIGALLRIPYGLAVQRWGGRTWTTVSAALLLVPLLALAVVVPSGWLAAQHHGVQLAVLAACAATSGLGGGNFASSMANISWWFPERRKGWALGLNAAGGNLGTAVVQLLVPLVVVAGLPAAEAHRAHHRVHLAAAGWVWVPLVVAAAGLAWSRMPELGTDGRAGRRSAASFREAAADLHTWVLSAIYVGTFGTFIGFSFALPLVVKESFPSFLSGHPFIATYLAGLGFTGALLGSAARPLGGWLADRLGGPQVTLAAFAGMAAGVAVAIAGVRAHAFPVAFAGFQVVFVSSGAGNGSTYKMIPAVFACRDGAPSATAAAKRRAAAAMSIAGAVGALGGVGVQVALRQASLHVSALEAAAATPAAVARIAATHAAWSVPALGAFLLSYVAFAGLTW